jgi:capsular exopolysaccharide synthesis family protein
MEDQFRVTKTETAGMSVKDVLFKYLRFLPLFILSLALALLIAFIYLRYSTPIYQSQGALIVKEDNSSSGGSGGAGGDRFQQMFVLDNSINIKNEIEILRSKPLLKRVIENLNLNFTYNVIGKIKESNIYSSSPFQVEVFEIADSNTFFTLHINVENNTSFRLGEDKQLYSFGQKFENEYGIFRLSYNPVAALSKEYKVIWNPTTKVLDEIYSKLIVAPGGSAGVIQIGFEASNPVLAADLITELMKEYQVATREDKNETNRRMLDFIDDRMKGVEKELDTITANLLRYQRENNLIDAESQSGSYFSRIEKTDEEVNQLRVEYEIAQTLENYMSDEKNAHNLVPSTLGLKDGTLSNLIAAYNVAQLERKALIDANIPETNIKVKEKEAHMERLRGNIFESIDNLRKSINTSIANLQKINQGILQQVRTLPLKEQNLLEIKTKQKTKQTVYNLLLEKREQTAISLAGTISNMKVIEEANVNPVPIKPKPSNVYLICFVAGLALPGLFVFGLEVLNDKVNSRYDIERITDVSIIGEIGHSYLDDRLVVKPNHRSVVAEQFRIIRSNLQYVLPHTPKPVILVTSSFSGEGKSFMSTNIGAVLSLTNKKTIVLEFDIRKPKILSHLNLPKKPGITNYLLGKISLEELPIPVPSHDNLFVLACGPIPPNPGELLLDPKLNELFAYLKKEFDVIIIDTAPVGMVSDALTLSRYADASLYVVRQGHTYKKQINLINEFNSQGKLPKISIILNDVKQRVGYGYYGYGRYGYGYGYSEKSGYFTEDAPPPTLFSKWFGWMDMKKWDRKKTKV